jgi:hypothetical protein
LVWISDALQMMNVPANAMRNHLTTWAQWIVSKLQGLFRAQGRIMGVTEVEFTGRARYVTLTP